MLILLSLSSAPALAQDIVVPTDYATIGEAITNATAGQWIHIEAGDYCEDVHVDKSLDITGAGVGLTRIEGSCASGSYAWSYENNIGASYLSDLTIDGQGALGGLVVNGGVDLTIERLEVRDGYLSGGNGAGLAVAGGATASCDECAFCANRSDIFYLYGFIPVGGAAGAVINDGTLTLQRSVLVRNTAEADGGALAGGGTSFVHHNTFVGNSAFAGEAVSAFFGNVQLIDNIFVGHNGGYTVDNLFGSSSFAGSSHNLFFDNSLDSNVALGKTLTGDPMLTARGTTCDDYDLSLQAGSAAIGTALDIGIHDDIGAIDFDADPDLDGDGYPESTDCDDADPAVFPGATELCNGGDDDCDGVADDGLSTYDWYVDDDGDGYGDVFDRNDCTPPTAGYVELSGDCNDLDGSTYPGAVELCDGVDNDCDLAIDEGCPTDTGGGTLIDTGGGGTVVDSSDTGLVTDTGGGGSTGSNGSNGTNGSTGTIDTGGGGSTNGSTGGTTNGSTGGTTNGSTTPTGGDGAPDEVIAASGAGGGCACQATSGPAHAAWLLALGGLLVRRRRSS
jgi:MYXO-CTERM domain-containing protein